MKLTQQRNMSTLTLIFQTTVVRPFAAYYDFPPIVLDRDRLQTVSENLSSVIIQGRRVSESEAYSTIFVKVNFKIPVVTGENFYSRLKGLGVNEIPLPVDTFNKTQQSNENLVRSIINYIAWRKEYTIFDDHGINLKTDWNWQFEEYSGQNEKFPDYKITGVYVAVPIVPDIISETDFADFYSLQNIGKPIPLHRELLFEAKGLMRYKRERSTYLILYSALEIATKELIKYKLPDNHWLIDNMPSPDLKKIFVDYINIQIIEIADKDDIKNIMEMTGERNKIAHRGEPISKELLIRRYDFVKKMIEKIESAMGFDWGANSNI